MLPIVPPPVLLSAYAQGLFPMAESRRDQDIFWVEPRERAIIPIGGFHCSRSLARTIRRDVFTITVDSDFAGTIVECAAPRADAEDTWISGRIAASYQRLHEVGHAHSIECCQNGELVGGVYGVAFDRVFCGESMFSRATDASKVALAWLVMAMRRARMELLDCQFLTGHLGSLGAVEIAQDRYLELLQNAQARSYSSADSPLALPDGFAALLAEAEGAGLGSSPGYFIAQAFTQTS